MTDGTINSAIDSIAFGAVDNVNAALTLTNVKITGGGITGNTKGVSSSSGTTIMTDVIIDGVVTGVEGSGNFAMTNVTITSLNEGVVNAGQMQIDHSTITTAGSTIITVFVGNTLVANSKIAGGPPTGRPSGTGTLTCVGAYDGNYVALDTSCL